MIFYYVAYNPYLIQTKGVNAGDPEGYGSFSRTFMHGSFTHFFVNFVSVIVYAWHEIHFYLNFVDSNDSEIERRKKIGYAMGI